jgi:DoxX-like protein
VPESWLTFPIGTLKTAGAAGLLAGLADVPLIGTAAAIGLVLFFVCAIYTHVRASDYSSQFGLAIGFLSLAAAALVLGLASP